MAQFAPQIRRIITGLMNKFKTYIVLNENV